jgi:hypothetical protein
MPVIYWSVVWGTLVYNANLLKTVKTVVKVEMLVSQVFSNFWKQKYWRQPGQINKIGAP